LRVDTQKLPADLLRAYARAELQALAAQNPSGRPSAVQKKQARDAAHEKLAAEAKDGRYLRRKAYPVLWDRPASCLLVGTTSATRRLDGDRDVGPHLGPGLSASRVGERNHSQ